MAIYKALEYIQSSGTQYIDTGFMPGSDSKMEVDFICSQTGNACIAGSEYAWQSNGFSIYPYTVAWSGSAYGISPVGTKRTISLDKGKVYIDGTLKNTMGGSISKLYTVSLFAVHRVNNYVEGSSAKLYTCKLWDNDVLVRDFVPVQAEDGTLGMFDKVNQGFYPNNGTGTFTAGAETGETIDSTPEPQKVDAHTKFLLHGDSLEDASLYKNPVTNQGAIVSAGQSKFGNSSLYFDGQSVMEFQEIKIFNKDFTIDWWEYCDYMEGEGGTRFSSGHDITGAFFSFLAGFSTTYVWALSNETASNAIYGSLLSVTVDEWTHWALVRDGDTLKSFRNGIKFAETPINGSIYEDGISATIGGTPAPEYSFFKGFIEEFRITDTAVWTSNFTPPTKPYELPKVDYTDKVLGGGF